MPRGAFPPCNCPFPYRRIYAWGGSYADAAAGLFPDDKSSFIACYESAIALVNSIDITTVPYGQVRWLDYGGYAGYKSDDTYIDHGNVVNNPTNIPGGGSGTPPAGTADYGAISPGGSELSYMGLTNAGNGVNAGGYQIAGFGGGDGQPAHGVFGISRIMVDLSACKCDTKWSIVFWDTNSYPAPGFYTIECQCDSTTRGSCPACVNGSDPNGVCVDIPDTGWFYQGDPDLPISCQYFVPGFNCADLT
jgi:hypothetical protein